jgi:integrase
VRKHQKGCIRLERHKQTGRPLFWLGIWWEDAIEPDGTIKRKQRSRKLADYCDRYRSDRDVRPLLDEILGPLNAGRVDARSTMPINEFVEGHYLPFARENFKPSTINGYEKLWRTIKSHVGDTIMRDFRTVDAGNLLSKFAQNGWGRRSLQHAKSLLSGIFAYAKNVGVLDGVNPVQGAMIPKKAKPPEEAHAATRDEVQRMLDALEGNAKARAAIALMFYAGLRPGEARGLRWEDYSAQYDEATKTAEWRLSVHRSVWRTHTTSPKTESSKKPVPVIASLRLVLDELREAEGSPEAGPILCGRSGKPLDLNTLAKREILPILRRCSTCKKPMSAHEPNGHNFELDTSLPPWHGWYAFRRGIATEITSATKDVLAAKGLLRHSNISTTMAHYVKDVPDATARGMKLMEELCSKREVATVQRSKPN